MKHRPCIFSGALALLGSLWMAPAGGGTVLPHRRRVGRRAGYESRFLAQTESLAAAAARSLGDDSRVALLNGDAASRESLTAELQRLAQVTAPADSLAVFLIGHGTYDGEQYKYNLPGRDLDGGSLGELLARCPRAGSWW